NNIVTFSSHKELTVFVESESRIIQNDGVMVKRNTNVFRVPNYINNLKNQVSNVIRLLHSLTLGFLVPFFISFGNNCQGRWVFIQMGGFCTLIKFLVSFILSGATKFGSFFISSRKSKTIGNLEISIIFFKNG